MAQSHGIYYENVKAPGTLAEYPRRAADFEKLEDLKPWHCVALARHVLTGGTFVDIGKEMKHSPTSIGAISRSPAGQAFIAKMEEECKDPVKLVKNLLANDTLHMWAGWKQAWDWAVAKQDYNAVHKMAKEIGLQPALEEKEASGPTKISLHLSLQDLAAPMASSSFKVLDAEIVEETSDEET